MTIAGREIPSPATVAVLGRTGSGATAFLNSLPGVWHAPAFGAKTRPQDLGGRGTGGASLLADLLTAAGLWPRRADPIRALTEGQRAAATLVAALLSGEPTLALDRELDRLDPWTREALWPRLTERRTVLATHDLALAERCDLVVVLGPHGPLACESPDALVSRLGLHRFAVETERRRTTRALVEPLAVDVAETPEGLEFRAREGQEAIVRLLLEGYGDVRSFVVRRPTLFEAATALLESP